MGFCLQNVDGSNGAAVGQEVRPIEEEIDRGCFVFRGKAEIVDLGEMNILNGKYPEQSGDNPVAAQLVGTEQISGKRFGTLLPSGFTHGLAEGCLSGQRTNRDRGA